MISLVFGIGLEVFINKQQLPSTFNAKLLQTNYLLIQLISALRLWHLGEFTKVETSLSRHQFHRIWYQQTLKITPSTMLRSSHSFSTSLERKTGILLWITAIRWFGVVVIMLHEFTISPVGNMKSWFSISFLAQPIPTRIFIYKE